MAYATRSYARSYSDSGGLPPAIKWLLISNVGIYLLQFFGGLGGAGRIFDFFWLRPLDVVSHFFIWQLVTYMFLHGGVFHIAFNMFALWVFGVPLEQAFGTRNFLNF
jgi:membrane associated rhomboid family serine protease